MAEQMLAIGVHVATLLLLSGLIYIYTSNYKKFKSKYTIGLVFFAAFMFVETLMALYFESTMVMYYSLAAEFNATIVQIVKAIGLAILLWISLE